MAKHMLESHVTSIVDDETCRDEELLLLEEEVGIRGGNEVITVEENNESPVITVEETNENLNEFDTSNKAEQTNTCEKEKMAEETNVNLNEFDASTEAELTIPSEKEKTVEIVLVKSVKRLWPALVLSRNGSNLNIQKFDKKQTEKTIPETAAFPFENDPKLYESSKNPDLKAAFRNELKYLETI